MKASVYIAASLDGFIARKDGTLTRLDNANSVERVISSRIISQLLTSGPHSDVLPLS